VHTWRVRRARWGELLQLDTSEHDWLEGRGEKLYLIALIDDATSRVMASFVVHDSTEENLRLLGGYLARHGRPLAVYTDKASLFQTAPKGVHHRRHRPSNQPRLGGRCGSWGSSGSPPTRPRPKGGSSVFSAPPRTGW
jgi:hypothetical protein